jgi:hypothetical protein
MPTIYEYIIDQRKSRSEARDALKAQYGDLEYQLLARQWRELIEESIEARQEPLLEVCRILCHITHSPESRCWILAATQDLADMVDARLT